MPSAIPLQTDIEIDLARTRLRDGDVPGAIDALRERIRKEPTTASLRIFYFQLLATQGDWERAGQQLDTIKTLGNEHLPFVEVYKDALTAEQERLAVLASGSTPHVMGEPLPWLAKLIKSLQHLAQGEFAAAAQLRGEAFDEAPALAGTLQTDNALVEFDWIADADTRFGPVLEIFNRARYAWLPWQYIARIEIPAPSDLRDCIWTPAQITLSNGGSLPTLIPSRYAGSESANAKLQLARQTEWQALPEEHWVGLGQKELVTETDQYPLLSLRSISLNPVEPEEAQASAN